MRVMDIIVLLCGMSSYCMLVTGATFGGSGSLGSCVLPFRHGSKSYETCIYSSGGYWWCSTGDDDEWGKCTEISEAESGVYVMLAGKDQRITHQTGTIISHRGYPQVNYPWNVDSTLGVEERTLLVTMKIIEFKLDDSETNGYCHDFLQINDAVKYCGTQLKSGEEIIYISVNKQFNLKFHTNGWTNTNGFKLQYELVSVSCGTDGLQRAYHSILPGTHSDYYGYTVSAECIIRLPLITDTFYCDSSSDKWKLINNGSSASACFNILDAIAMYNIQEALPQETTNKEGYVISHTTFPNNYTANIGSSLTITGLQPQQIVQVKFLLFDLYYDSYYPGCFYDYLELIGTIYDYKLRLCSDPNREPIIGRWYNYSVSSSSLSFRFVTDWDFASVGSGFYFQYQVLDTVATTSTSIPTTRISTTKPDTTGTKSTRSIPATSGMSSTPPTYKYSADGENATTVMQTTYSHILSGTETTMPNITEQNRADGDSLMQNKYNSVTLGAGIGVAALVIIIAVIIAALIVFKRRREKEKSKPNNGPIYGYTNATSGENTPQVRMSALPSDPDVDNYYDMPETEGINSVDSQRATTSQNWANNAALSGGAGETDYDMAEPVETGDIHHSAGDVRTDNNEYTLAEEVTPKRIVGAQAQRKQTEDEDEYQLADSTAEDYANIESIHRAEEEKTIEEKYSSVLMANKTKKTNIDPGVTALVDNDLYGT